MLTIESILQMLDDREEYLQALVKSNKMYADRLAELRKIRTRIAMMQALDESNEQQNNHK